MSKINIMIVEDQAMPRELFEMYIKSKEEYNLIASIDNADVADIYCAKNTVDLILMDVLTKGGKDGLTAASKVKAISPKTKIVIVTSMPEVSYIDKAKAIGIEGFWYKDLAKEPILSIIEKVLAGEIVYPDKTPELKIGMASTTEFNKRELEIMRCLVKGYTNKEIAEELFVSVDTVHSRVNDILSKTGFKTRTKLAAALISSGFIIENIEE